MDKGGTSDQVLSRPNGGGAVSSIGTDFQINLNKGTGSYAVPIDLPDGYRSQSPQLALQYSTGAGHGEFGLGWSLGTLAISRDSRRGIPFYRATDSFLLNGEVLLPLGNNIFRPAVDSTFQRIRRLATGWEITDRQGTWFMLGTVPQSQERHPGVAGEDGVLYWLLDRINENGAHAAEAQTGADGTVTSDPDDATNPLNVFHDDSSIDRWSISLEPETNPELFHEEPEGSGVSRVRGLKDIVLAIDYRYDVAKAEAS